jgi:hypothetical protein
MKPSASPLPSSRRNSLIVVIVALALALLLSSAGVLAVRHGAEFSQDKKSLLNGIMSVRTRIHLSQNTQPGKSPLGFCLSDSASIERF